MNAGVELGWTRHSSWLYALLQPSFGVVVQYPSRGLLFVGGVDYALFSFRQAAVRLSWQS